MNLGDLEDQDMTPSDLRELVERNRQFVGEVEKATSPVLALVYKEHNRRISECCDIIEDLLNIMIEHLE